MGPYLLKETISVDVKAIYKLVDLFSRHSLTANRRLAQSKSKFADFHLVLKSNISKEE